MSKRKRTDKLGKQEQGRRKEIKVEEKKQAIRAKYGPKRKPSLVTVKNLDGEVIKVVDQSKLSPPTKWKPRPKRPR